MLIEPDGKTLKISVSLNFGMRYPTGKKTINTLQIIFCSFKTHTMEHSGKNLASQTGNSESQNCV